MANLRTYIVEDSPVIRENLIATLEEMVPLEVVGTAEDESTAKHWLGRPDNACDLGAQRKLVVLSNYATPDMRRKCLELGADKVFDKSNEIDGLINYCTRLAQGDSGNSAHGALS